MNIVLIPNTTKDTDYRYTRLVLAELTGHAHIFMQDIHPAFPLVSLLPENQLYEHADLAIALGGDGTILAAAGEVARHDIPILGINIGHLGFLAEIEPHAISPYLQRLLDGDYKVESRMMLRADVSRGGEVIETFHALNDIVVSRASFSRLLSLRTVYDGHLLDSFVADGVILSTPTGSTAYSLSAGGPIVDPALDVILVTPICPHTMHARSMVLPLNKPVTVALGPYGGHDSFVTADGKQGVSVLEGDCVTVVKSNYKTKLIKLTDTTFYDTIRQKLSERGGAEQ